MTEQDTLEKTLSLSASMTELFLNRRLRNRNLQKRFRNREKFLRMTTSTVKIFSTAFKDAEIEMKLQKFRMSPRD